MSLFLGLDIGTSAVKAIIVDAEDREQASAEALLRAARLAHQACGGALTGRLDGNARITLEPDAAFRAGLQERRAIYRHHYAKMPSS